MSRFNIILLLVTTLISFAHNELYAQGKDNDDWRPLFNGKNLDGWVVKIHHHPVGDNYANTFRVEDGKIQINYEGYTKFDQRYGHLFFREPFSSYHLKFEYRFTDQWLEDAAPYTFRNSGVMFHAQDPTTILPEQDWPVSVEYQILADENGDGRSTTGNMCSPGTEVFFREEPCPYHCLSSSAETYPWNQWVSGELIVYADSLVTHIVNGDTALQYTKPQVGGGVANGFDPAVIVNGTPLTRGYIGLQAEGQGIEFREIKIKTFK